MIERDTVVHSIVVIVHMCIIQRIIADIRSIIIVIIIVISSIIRVLLIVVPMVIITSIYSIIHRNISTIIVMDIRGIQYTLILIAPIPLLSIMGFSPKIKFENISKKAINPLNSNVYSLFFQNQLNYFLNFKKKGYIL